MNHVITPKGIHVNLSPDAFHLWAKQYFQCRRDFKEPDHFSPVPYFLLSRSIELELKSRHLINAAQGQVKKDFGHDLEKLYRTLPESQKVLTKEEEETLTQASAVYKGKGFEYWHPEHALRGYANFPKLKLLDSIAEKFLGPDTDQ